MQRNSPNAECTSVNIFYYNTIQFLIKKQTFTNILTMKRINENEREGRGENTKHVPYKNVSLNLMYTVQRAKENKKKKKNKQDVMFVSSIWGSCRPFYCFFAKSVTHTSCEIKHHKNKTAVWKVSFLSSLVTMSIDVLDNIALHRSGSSIHCSQTTDREKDGWRRRGEEK